MVKPKEKYMLDANTLMTAARLFYAYDIIPLFWKNLDEKMKEGRIILLDMVKNEIDHGQDELKEWINNRKDKLRICNHIAPEIIDKYAEVMQYVQECGFYNEKGLAGWAQKDTADAWQVAAAAAKGYQIITFEQSAGSLHIKNKSGKVKIPYVAVHFNVKVYNLYYMMRSLGIRI